MSGTLLFPATFPPNPVRKVWTGTPGWVRRLPVPLTRLWLLRHRSMVSPCGGITMNRAGGLVLIWGGTGLVWDAWLGPAPARSFNAVMAPPPSCGGFPMWRYYEEYGGGILSDWGAHMFDIVQWALQMDHSGPVAFVPPPDRNAKRGMQFH